jgi:hypothetical protein
MMEINEKWKKKGISAIVIMLLIFSSFVVVDMAKAGTPVTAPPYNVTFVEANLPVGTTWGIILWNYTKTITATNTTISTGGSISELLYNGTYNYNVIGTPWWFNSTYGTLTVSGSSLTITINFTENFTLTVKENGLLSGMTWTAGVGIVFGQQPIGSTTTYYDFSYATSFTTNSSFGIIKYHGSTEFSVNTIFDYNISFPNMVTIPANQTISGSPIYYSNITFNANATLIVNFTPLFHVVTVEGYVNPNGTSISSLDFISHVNSQGQYYIGDVVANGFYKITTTQFANLLFYKDGYSPKVVRITSSQPVQWVNITLQKISITFNMSQILTIKNYQNLSWIYNFNLSNAPVNFSYVQNGIYFARISQNELIAFANISGLPPFPGIGNLNPGQPIPPPLILNVTFKLNPYQKYMFLVFTNASSNPIKFIVNGSSNGYTTINLNKYTNNFTLDPLIEYSTAQAVISAPSVVAYDSAVVISGTNSVASENATITNWTWKITGPQNQLYIEYGKTITQYFSITGLYTITLTVTDSNGLTNTTSTTINVVSARQDPNIKITYTLTILRNGYYEYNVTVNARDNVSISQFLASVDSRYVNVTFVKENGYIYYYQVKFNPNSFGYGNHTIKFEAINTLDGYNTVVTYQTFGSLNQGGLIAYLFGHIALTLVILVFITILISFIYVVYKERLIKKIEKSRKIYRNGRT